MSKGLIRSILLLAILFIVQDANAVPVTFSKLAGALIGGSPAGTAVWQADLSTVGLANILSITIADNSGGLGGATGQFSGFDLDTILLSNTNCAGTACADLLSGMPVFDFTPAATFFTPGVQRPPVDPKLFGTDAGGSNVDNSVATLGVFDGNSTTAIPGADGFLSMGDNGILSFNLTAPVSTTNLFLYIGEVGDNGEVAAGQITVSNTPVPEPSTALLLLLGLGSVGFLKRRQK